MTRLEHETLLTATEKIFSAVYGVLEILRNEKDKSPTDGVPLRQSNVAGVGGPKVLVKSHSLTLRSDSQESPTTGRYDPTWLSSNNRIDTTDLRKGVAIGPLCDRCYCTVLKAVK